ncbi:MAG: hypothetical protein NVS3B10_14160 [Polyangiales bacterium]
MNAGTGMSVSIATSTSPTGGTSFVEDPHEVAQHAARSATLEREEGRIERARATN